MRLFLAYRNYEHYRLYFEGDKRSFSDTEDPVVAAFTLTSGNPTTDPGIVFSLEAADNKGVAAYLINESATPPLFTDPGWQASKPSTYTVSAGFGLKTVYAWAKDSAGNVSAPLTTQVSYEQSWRDPLYTYRRMRAFDNSAQSEDLAHFPVLVKLTAANFNYDHVRDDGKDIRFVDGDGSDLPYEIESWTDNGNSFMWVKVPKIDGGSTTDHNIVQLPFLRCRAGREWFTVGE